MKRLLLRLRLRQTHEMGDQPLTDPDIHSGQRQEELRGLVGTGAVSLAELGDVFHGVPRGLAHLAQLLDVTDSQLQDVRLLQLGNILPFCL